MQLKKQLNKIRLKSLLLSLKYFPGKEPVIKPRYLFVPQINLTLELSTDLFMLSGFKYTISLSKAGAKFVKNDRNELLMQFQNLTVNVQTQEDLYILNEIFINGTYNFKSAASSVVVDIGMNVGYASLYFASRSDVQAVYSYEPFGPTFNEGLKNFDLNKKEIAKINPFNFGLGAKNTSLEIEYFPELRGTMSSTGLRKPAKHDKLKKPQKENIEIQAISGLISKIKDSHPKSKLILKIDCEGEEYSILEKLQSTGELKQVDLIMMEWHQLGPLPLEKILIESGFTLLSFTPLSNNVGMIYGYKML